MLIDPNNCPTEGGIAQQGSKASVVDDETAIGFDRWDERVEKERTIT